MKEESNMINLKKNEIQREHRTFFEVGYFADGIWCAFEKAFDYDEALEIQAKLFWSGHIREWAIVQVDIKTMRKQID
jgi:hypothetical protein